MNAFMQIEFSKFSSVEHWDTGVVFDTAENANLLDGRGALHIIEQRR